MACVSRRLQPDSTQKLVLTWVVLIIVTRPAHPMAAPLDADVRCSDLLAEMQFAHNREVVLIRSSHEETVRKLLNEIEGLRRACSRSTPTRSNERLLSSAPAGAAFPPDAVGSDPLDRESGSMTRGGTGTRQTPRPAQAARRQLLRSGSAALYCSKVEFRSVIESPGVVGAVLNLLQTNPPCGVCMAQAVMTVAHPTAFEKGRAVVVCLHQEENRCDQATGLSRIEPMLLLASIADRGSLVRMLELVEAGLHITPDAVMNCCRAARCHALQLVPTACSRRSSTCTARDLSARSCE
jgi:hypothetical protein